MRQVLTRALTVLACLAVWLSLVVPNEIDRMTLGAFVRIPLEGLVIVALALVLPPRATRAVAAGAGALLGVLVIVKVLDMGFFVVLDRPFDVLADWGNLGPAVGVLGDSIGGTEAVAVAATAVLLAVAVLVCMPLAVLRLSRLVANHRRSSVRAVTALGAVWILCAATGLQITSDERVAAASTAGLAYDKGSYVLDAIRDRQTFANAIAADRFADTPDDNLLTGLRGKDVLLVFVESYGRVAVEDPALAPQVQAVLDAGTSRLRAAGFSSRSAFLTSPTFGGTSWLAHSTMQSGLWVDSQRRYDQLITEDRLTLTQAFGRAGWRTAFVLPANAWDWPEGPAFYHFDTLYDSRNLGYRGPKLGYARVPDQYTLSAFRRLELAETDRAPVMAEIDLVSSHQPWTPLPRLLDWGEVGDGSVFEEVAERDESAREAFPDPDVVRARYRQSIEYSLGTIISFLETHPDPDLVLIVLGDHQPPSYVAGQGASHDVPITIIASDPAVLDRVSGWGWQPGMLPRPDAPVLPMDTFRDRFLTAYGPQPAATFSTPTAEPR